MEVDTQSISPNDVLCLIPMKDVNEAKKRLRVSFPSEKQPLISTIITKLFVNTIETVKKTFQFAVVSPSEDTLELALENGASFIYQDPGIDLNDALTTSINYALLTSKWKYVLILTADLPYLADESLLELQNSLRIDTFTIFSAPEKSNIQGTSCLLIPLQKWSSCKLMFGPNSFNLFLQQFQNKHFKFNPIKHRVGFDLDTFEDLNELKNNSPAIFKKIVNEEVINQLFT